VIYKSEAEYDLYLNTDTNLLNRCQWFYFSVSNTQKNIKVTFNIKNLTKYPHFIKEGMRPLAFSLTNKEWIGKTTNIKIQRTDSIQIKGERIIELNDLQENISTSNKRVYYTLSFSYTFKDNDHVYFAPWRPYSYTDLTTFLKQCEIKLSKSSTKFIESSLSTTIETNSLHYKRERLCYSLGGIPIYLITVTGVENKAKTYVVITARVHSSETAGSYKAEGILKCLLGNTVVANELRKEYIFLIAPMVNPDGVVLGNTRFSLGGWDLNRCWGNPIPTLQPSIYFIKEYIRKLNIGFYFDLHGHSKALNSFIFACYRDISQSPSSWAKTHLFPRIFADKCQIISLEQCQFNSEHDKVIWDILG